jgi:hypothetical protein
MLTQTNEASDLVVVVEAYSLMAAVVELLFARLEGLEKLQTLTTLLLNQSQNFHGLQKVRHQLKIDS